MNEKRSFDLCLAEGQAPRRPESEALWSDSQAEGLQSDTRAHESSNSNFKATTSNPSNPAISYHLNKKNKPKSNFHFKSNEQPFWPKDPQTKNLFASCTCHLITSNASNSTYSLLVDFLSSQLILQRVNFLKTTNHTE